MDCNNARLLLEVAHPLATELDARDKEELASHLADCPDCGPWAESEHRLDDHVGTAVRAVPVPARLSQSILDRLQVERHLWCRVRAVRAAGVAAALLLVLGLTWLLWWNRKPAPDLDAFSRSVAEFLYTTQQVEDSFADQGVTMTAPPQFDYRLLQSHGLRDFQGKQVPFLLFFYAGAKDKQPALAEVYVVSSQQFDLAEAPKQTALSGSRKNIMILKHPEPGRQGVLYVIVFTEGTQLQVFFLPGAKPT